MATPVFVGDELSAAGFRLAGVRVRVPTAGEETEALAEARGEASLVLVGAAVAARIDDAALRTALVAVSPLVVIVPDAQGAVAVPDLAARLRTQLGL